METDVIAQAELLHFAANMDARGSLIAMENGANLPFEPKRVFYIFDVPHGAMRGGHAHKVCKQVIIAGRGGVSVIAGHRYYRLFSPYMGLYIPPGVKVDLSDFSPNALLIVISSEPYNADDYIR